MADVFARNGLEPLRLGTEAFAAQVRQDHAYWAEVVKATGSKPED